MPPCSMTLMTRKSLSPGVCAHVNAGLTSVKPVTPVSTSVTCFSSFFAKL